LCVAGIWSWRPSRCPRRRLLCIAGLCSFIVVPRPLPAAALVVPRRYLIVAPGRFPRRHAGNWAWCPGRCPRRRYFCAAGTLSWCPCRCPRRRSLFVAPTEVRCEFIKSSFFVIAVFLWSNRVITRINMHREATGNPHMVPWGWGEGRKKYFFLSLMLYETKYFYLSALLSSNKKTFVVNIDLS
jgi:hypothetical protein